MFVTTSIYSMPSPFSETEVDETISYDRSVVCVVSFHYFYCEFMKGNDSLSAGKGTRHLWGSSEIQAD